jgi:hypothetical protein
VRDDPKKALLVYLKVGGLAKTRANPAAHRKDRRAAKASRTSC